MASNAVLTAQTAPTAPARLNRALRIRSMGFLLATALNAAIAVVAPRNAVTVAIIACVIETNTDTILAATRKPTKAASACVASLRAGIILSLMTLPRFPPSIILFLNRLAMAVMYGANSATAACSVL